MSKIEIKVGTEDLMKLLGGDDPDVRLTITSSVTQQFVNRYLKGLAHDTMVQEVAKRIEKGVKQAVTAEVGKINYNSVTLTDDMKEEIAKEVRREANSVLQGLVEAEMSEAMTRVSGFVKTVVDNVAINEMRKQVRDKVAKAL